MNGFTNTYKNASNLYPHVTNFMPNPLYTLLTLAATITALSAATVDFNQADDLNNNFAIALYDDAGAALQPVINTVSGGLNNSGAIGANQHISTQAIIYTSGFALQEGSTYTVSAYFRGIAYNGVGFTNSISPVMLYLPETSITYLGGEADNLYTANYTTTDQDWQPSQGPQAGYTNDDWIFRSLSISYHGEGEFELSYATFISNENGVLGELADSGTYTFINAELNNVIYAFIFRDQGTQTDMLIDDFTAVVPEPASYAVLAAFGILALVLLRRHRH